MDQGNILLSSLGSVLHSAGPAVRLHAGEFIEVSPSKPHAFFPDSALVCLIGETPEEQRVEISMVGREGMTGAVLFSDVPAAWEVQVGGSAYKVPHELIRELFESSPEVRQKLLAFAAYFFWQTSQSCVCLAAHAAEQRLARWLLSAQDRLQADVLPFGQQVLSEMIGVRQPTISLVAGKLQRAGGIKVDRGRIRIIDRDALLDSACDCYRVTAGYLRDYARLLDRPSAAFPAHPKRGHAERGHTMRDR